MDARRPLENGTIIELDGIKYSITEFYSSGGSCLVYNAGYRDSMNEVHTVRIKEFYPSDVKTTREDKMLIFNDEAGKTKYQKRFLEGVKLQSELRSSEINVNDIAALRDISYANGTIYSILDFYNGKTMSARNYNNIRQILAVIMQTATALKKYHGAGYIYLDLKPDNIFTVRNTDGSEKVLLFDFDSMVKKDGLAAGNVQLSYSPKYAAPELKKGRYDSVSDKTDHFSLGCILFSYVMRRVPNALDQRSDSKWCFSTDCGLLNKISDDFLNELTVFFHKTLSSLPSDRFDSDDEIIDALQKLYSLSEIKVPFLESDFASPSTFFVGREKEMQGIDKALSHNGKVILTGVGGIGKSTTAINYAAQNNDKFDTVIFLRYAGNAGQIIEDVPIKNLSSDADKMAVLHELCNERVLIVIDNYDSNEPLNEWLDLPCKMIITSRIKHDDMPVSSLEIGGLSEADELFYHYCKRPFSAAQRDIVRRLLFFIGNHAMTVELIAKLLRNPEIEPEKVLEKLSGAAVSEIERDKLRQVKDYMPKADSIEQHIDVLFDMFSFSDEEEDCLYGIALIIINSLRKNILFKWCDFIRSQTLNDLVYKGWVQYDPDFDIVSLHPLIADRALLHLQNKSDITEKLLLTLKTALSKTAIMSNEARNYTLGICENAAAKIRIDSYELAELEMVMGLSYIGRRNSAANKHIMRSENIYRNLNAPIIPSVFAVYYAVKKLGYGNSDNTSEALAELNMAFRNCMNSNPNYLFCIAYAKAARNITYSTMLSNEHDKRTLWKITAELFEAAFKKAADDIEKKYAAAQLYDIYSDCTSPIYSETKALRYRELAGREVTIIYKDSVLEKTEQERQSDQLEAMIADGNTAGALLLAGKIYAKFKLTKKPLDPYLTIQLVGLMKSLKRYNAAIALLESEKNDYNCLEIARISIESGKSLDICKYLDRAEKYWQCRLNSNNHIDTPAQLASVYVLKARYLFDGQAKLKAEKTITSMLDDELRLCENALSADCYDYARTLEGKNRELYLFYFAALADIDSVTEKIYKEYCDMFSVIKTADDHKIVHLYFRAEYENSAELYRKAIQLSTEFYGIDDHRTALMQMQLAELTGDKHGINFNAVYERQTKAVHSFSEVVSIRLKCIKEYEEIGDAEKASELTEKLDTDISSFKGDNYQYYESLKEMMSFYRIRNNYDKVHETALKCLEVAPDKDKADICIVISENCRESGGNKGYIEWLEKSISFLENMKKLSTSKGRRLLHELKDAEEFYLDAGDYDRAAFYRNKYNAAIQCNFES